MNSPFPLEAARKDHRLLDLERTFACHGTKTQCFHLFLADLKVDAPMRLEVTDVERRNWNDTEDQRGPCAGFETHQKCSQDFSKTL